MNCSQKQKHSKRLVANFKDLSKFYPPEASVRCEFIIQLKLNYINIFNVKKQWRRF